MNKTEQRQIKSIWSDWKNFPSTIDDGCYMPVKSFRDYINSNYNPSRKVDCSAIHAILKYLEIKVIKPNGVYNIPSFNTEKKDYVVEWMYNNPQLTLTHLKKPSWIN
jgi:hypothetical protein